MTSPPSQAAPTTLTPICIEAKLDCHPRKKTALCAAEVGLGSKLEQLTLSESSPLYPSKPDLDVAREHFAVGPGANLQVMLRNVCCGRDLT
jgi:hypothetical protein